MSKKLKKLLVVMLGISIIPTIIFMLMGMISNSCDPPMNWHDIRSWGYLGVFLCWVIMPFVAFIVVLFSENLE